jgi:hypothetical protein
VARGERLDLPALDTDEPQKALSGGAGPTNRIRAPRERVAGQNSRFAHHGRTPGMMNLIAPPSLPAMQARIILNLQALYRRPALGYCRYVRSNARNSEVGTVPK